MEKQESNSAEPGTPIFSQDSIDNPPEGQQSSDSEQPADYSQTTPWQLREPSSGKRKSAIKIYQPVTTSCVTEQVQECVQKPAEPSQDHDHASNRAAVVMSRSAVKTVAYNVPRSNEPETLNVPQQDSIGNTSQKQRPIYREQPPAYSQIPDDHHITTRHPNQPPAGYPMRPTKGYQPVPTRYATAQSQGHVHEVGSRHSSNSAVVFTTQPTSIAVSNVPYVNDYMELSMFSFLCCCWCIGIFAIMKSSEAKSRNLIGDYEGALASAQSAKKIAYSSIICGVFGIIFAILVPIISFSSYRH